MKEQSSRDSELSLLKLEELRDFKDEEKTKAVENAVHEERQLAHDNMEQVSENVSA